VSSCDVVAENLQSLSALPTLTCDSIRLPVYVLLLVVKISSDPRPLLQADIARVRTFGSDVGSASLLSSSSSLLP
jgi:hypothetical protein